MTAPPIVRLATASAGDVREALAGTDAQGLTVLFATTDVELGALGRALVRDGRRVVGAATGRVIGSRGFAAHGVAGFHLPGGRFTVAETLIEDAAAFGPPDARDLVRGLRARLAACTQPVRFALLLVDADVRCEERLIAALGMELSGIPIVGGSAGDLYFNPAGHGPGTTRILYHGRVLAGAAVLCLVAGDSPVAAYCHTHYVPGGHRIVITAADPARRLVQEIDGRRALAVYAEKCGFRRAPRLGGNFAPHPAMVRIGGNYYARGIQRVHEDGSLEFACAIEPGIVATIAHPGDMVAKLEEQFAALRARIGRPELVIGLDCAARTSYMEQSGLTSRIEATMREHRVVGFATLGEQFNTVHANNSLTCLGIAAA
jgi:hypothetical protein